MALGRRFGLSRRILAGAAAIASLAALASACGESRPRKSAVLHISTALGSEQIATGESPDFDALVGEISRIYQLYAPPSGFSRAELVRLLDHYNIPLGEVVLHLVYRMDGNGDGRLSLRELLNGIRTQVIPFRWIAHGESAPLEQIRAAVDATYPEALEPARELLVERLARFDRVTLGGDGDGRLSRAETALAGLAMKLFSQTTFTPPEGATPEEALNARVLRQMLELQILGRFPRAAAFGELDSGTAALERQSFGLELVWAARRVREPIARPEAADILARDLGVDVARADKLLRLHDLRFAGGDADGKVSATELFAAAAAVRHGLAMIGFLGKEPELRDPRNAFGLPPAQGTAAPGLGGEKKQMLYRHLFAALPEHGRALMHDGAVQTPKGPVYWDKLAPFDGRAWEGNGDGRIDATEFAAAFTVLRMIDQAFLLLDVDHSATLSREEISNMFAAFGVTDAQAATLFMSIDVGAVGGIEGLFNLVTGDNPSVLKPLDFVSRILVLLDGI